MDGAREHARQEGDARFAMALGTDDRSEEFLEHARRAYGDLRNPYYGFFADALGNNPWKSLLNGFREFLVVEDWTDPLDVSFSYVLNSHRRSRSGWLLWLSGVGPYALLAYGGDPDTTLARADVVTDFGEDRPAEERRIIEMLREAGLTLLSAEEIEATVDFHPPDGRFPVSTFTMLFGESDVPWWHDG
ncbi:hypothetical protein ACIOD2_44000 [Amycolatopsis sp. NPDC088138]|uniref:hypothetical protein n=1 Tax=Amycolatopsis sp. NPDC088138 TaxID=3363938 RepID=UPI0038168425